MKGGNMRSGSMRTFAILLAVTTAAAGAASALELRPSQLDLEQQRLRYQFTTQALTESQQYYLAGDTGTLGEGQAANPGLKSPGKAFFLSALVPGLGQYYYGNKFKAAIFFAADVAAWTMEFTYHADGNRRTNEFNAFNDLHWSRDSYENKYLEWGYGKNDDDSLSGYTELSHHLPDTKTQQYYEMTGKYDQFAWGWDDAYRIVNGDTVRLDAWAHDSTIRILGPSTTPVSPRRNLYEEMRYQANRKFSQATAMIMVSIANHLLSAFEALYTTTRHNRSLHTPQEFSQLRFNASLKSYNSKHDTPYLTVTYRFK
jgi:hypothetical protein